jgi:hypothetical protein
MSMPQRHGVRIPSARLAPATGLLGAAAELAIAGCLVELSGERALQLSPGRFKSASQLLDDFRKLVARQPAFLSASISDPKAHESQLAAAIGKMAMVFTCRAAALHAGVGLTREACVAVARDVHELLRLLGKSSRIAPYLRSLPIVQFEISSSTVLLDDIVRRLPREAAAPAELLSALYLVVPEVPNEQPDWFEAIQRACIVPPRRKDIRLLLRSIEDAQPAQLQRAGNQGPGLAVTVRRDDPHAIPIAPAMLSRKFTNVAQKWNADLATANGRLDDGVLDLPPIDFIHDLFAMGLAALRIELGRESFSAHEIWPFVAAGLATQGTPGPYWFLVRMTDDLGQLEALLRRATEARTAWRIRAHIDQALEGISSRRGARDAPKWIDSVLARGRKSEECRSALVQRCSQKLGTTHDPGSLQLEVEQALATGTPVGPLLTGITAGTYALSPDAKRYWSRVLCEAACTIQDVHGLVQVLRDTGLNAAHTEARKALAFIDVAIFGPTVPDATLVASSPSVALEYTDLATGPMPSIAHGPKLFGTIDLPRLLWALEWARRKGRGALRAADLARIVSEHAGVAFAEPNAGRAFRRFKSHDPASRYWREEPAEHYAITQSGSQALMLAAGTAG